jgi:hypothetical protein
VATNIPLSENVTDRVYTSSTRKSCYHTQEKLSVMVKVDIYDFNRVLSGSSRLFGGENVG